MNSTENHNSTVYILYQRIDNFVANLPRPDVLLLYLIIVCLFLGIVIICCLCFSAIVSNCYHSYRHKRRKAKRQLSQTTKSTNSEPVYPKQKTKE